MLEDKRLILTRDLEVRAVVGYEHPPGCLVAFLKYTFTGKGLWKGFERVVREYNPSEVRKGRLVYDPNFGSEVPCVPTSDVLSAPDPLLRGREAVLSPKDALEERFLELYNALRVRELGIGGSLLLKIHHSNSDLDVLIYPRGDPLTLWEELEECSKLEDEREWPLRVARGLSIPVGHAKRLYSKAKRALFKGTPTSFAFVKRTFEKYGNSVSTPLGPFEGIIEMEPCPEGLYYPHRCWAGRYLVESYESAFAKVFAKGGKVRVRGYLWERHDGVKVIRVGGIEERGYLLLL